MKNFKQSILEKIILEQELIIGPLAWEEAAKVAELTVNEEKKKVSLKNAESAEDAINHLVKQYERLFGRASVEACKDAVKDILPKLEASEVPEMLR